LAVDKSAKKDAFIKINDALLVHPQCVVVDANKAA